MDIDNTRISNPLLAQEIADFTHDCYSPSRARLFMRQPDLGDVNTNNGMLRDLHWIGSRLLLNTSGYYDTDYSKTPRAAWPYNATRDAGLPEVTGGGGYPTCKQWWSDSGIGLKARIQDQVDPGLMSKFMGWAKWLSPDEVHDSVIRQIASPSRQVQGDVYTDYGGQVGGTLWNGLARAGGTLGVAMGSLAYFPGMDMVRQALPMVMAFLKMAIVVSMPLVLVIGAYQLSTTMTLSVVFFSLIFVDFWFQLARWVDSTILNALYGVGSPHLSLDPVMGLNTATQDAILNFVMAAMFLILPTFWVGALSWAGVHAGSVLNGLQVGTSGVRQAGSQAGSLASTGISAVFSNKDKTSK